MNIYGYSHEVSKWMLYLYGGTRYHIFRASPGFKAKKSVDQ